MPPALEELEEQYTSTLPLAERFSKKLTEAITHTLESSKIPLSIPIQYRIKQWPSIAEKLDRKPRELGHITELTDLIGLRLILQFHGDINRVTKLIERKLHVIEKQDKAKALDENQFGYLSMHLLVKMPETWIEVPTYEGLGNLVAEVQIRTTAQHIWAAASHTLQYKNVTSIPAQLRRSLHRVSALLETVDLELERIVEAREIYRDQAPIEANHGPLDVDILEKTLDSTWPKINKLGVEDYDDLITELLHFKINTIELAKNLILKHRKETLAYDKQAATRALKDNPEMAARFHQTLIQGVFFSHAGLTRHALSLEFGDAHENYIKNIFITKPSE